MLLELRVLGGFGVRIDGLGRPSHADVCPLQFLGETGIVGFLLYLGAAAHGDILAPASAGPRGTLLLSRPRPHPGDGLVPACEQAAALGGADPGPKDALRLCDATFSTIFRFDGARMAYTDECGMH